MLTFRDVTLQRGARVLFEHASFQVYAGESVALTGANGSGKTSLLSLITGDVDSTRGEVAFQAGAVLSQVEQESPETSRRVLDYVVDGDQELRQLEQKLEAARECGDGIRQAEWLEAIESVDGYSAAARAAQMLHGLGFADDDGSRGVDELSGGWRMRLNLARALMCRSDLLLLDEPTNHLDFEAVVWLEEWLENYAGAVLLISHDRSFLDRSVSRVLHIEDRRIKSWKGNYSAFEKQRSEVRRHQQAQHDRTQRRIEHMESFIHRFRAKASKAKQAQSRIKALERLGQVEAVRSETAMSFKLLPPSRLPDPLVSLRDVSAGYGSKAVLHDVTTGLQPGQRIGLLGPNGAGKTTFMRLLAGELANSGGELLLDKRTVTGYFAQHQVEQLDGESTAMDHMVKHFSNDNERQLRSYLGSFGFSDEKSLQPVSLFSGGEKARLVLAMMVRRRPNLLLLDEPTNHLDMNMRHALSMALQDYPGAIVLVSHDRHLLDSVVDELWVVGQGQITRFQGSLDEYAHNVREAAGTGGATRTMDQNKKMSRIGQRREQAEKRENLRPLRLHVSGLEDRINSLTTHIDDLDQRIADPALYQDSRRSELEDLLATHGKLRRDLEDTERQWIEASEELEGRS